MKTIEITADTYRLIAARLKDETGVAEWFNGSVTVLLTSEDAPASAPGTSENDSPSAPGSPLVEARLILTAVVCRRTETSPEGERRPVSDVVPVWWEFSTVFEGEPCPNEFSFSELKPYLIDYD